MCVIVYKPIGVQEPTLEILKDCFRVNPDGAGYMLALDGKVHVRKGFMTFKEFYSDYKKFVSNNNVDVINTSIVYHFRITTQGGVQKELCHPYPICKNYDEMRKLANTCDIALAHNGIIRITSVYAHGKELKYNDTMTFIKDYASLIINNDLFFGKNKNKTQLLENLISGSKLAIMNRLGYVKLIGNFVMKDGCYYSNSNAFIKNDWRQAAWF